MKRRVQAAVVLVLTLTLVPLSLVAPASAHRSPNLRARVTLLDVERNGDKLSVKYRVAARERNASPIRLADCTMSVRVDGSVLTTVQVFVDVTHRRWRRETGSMTIQPAPDGPVRLKLPHCHGKR